MDGLTIEMLSTNTEEHLCMCEHLKWNGTRESKEKIVMRKKDAHANFIPSKWNDKNAFNKHIYGSVDRFEWSKWDIWKTP